MRAAKPLAGTILAACLAVFPALAQDAAGDLPAPTGPVLLTVSGLISNTNDGDTARFDLEMLEALEPREVLTTTIWTEDVQHFTGVPLATLLRAVGVRDVMIHAMAVNDYAVDIPFEDWSSGGPVLAYARNGAPMSLRDKGPLWVIYPYDSDPAYRSEVIFSRSIWQLDRIVVGD